MEHINTSQRPLGLKLPNFLYPEKLFSSGLDGLFTVTMIFVGMAGCLYVLYLQSANQHSLEESMVLTASMTSGTAETLPAAIAVSAPEKTQPQYVEVKGDHQVGSPLSFIIDAFDPAVSYEFDFGNGKKVMAQNRVTEFTYARSGVYPVLLSIAYKGEKSVIKLTPVWVK